MKRTGLSILAVLFLLTGSFSQNVDDALRYSQIFYGGTSRFMAMGGAFTALGGDLSTLTQNPAGLGVFRSSEFTITPQLYKSTTSAGFNGITSDFIYNFNLSQAGFVSNIISNNSTYGLITLNFGYSFNKTNNLKQNIAIDGISTKSSMADYWVDKSNGTFYRDLPADNTEEIAFDLYIIDTVPGSNGELYGTVYSNYGVDPQSTYNQRLRRLVSYEGYTGEHAFTIGGNYSNQLYFGATLGIHSMKYTSHYEHLESTDIPLNSNFENFTYTDHYEEKGTGYSLKLGAIFKPIEPLRIGIAFHSPTIYKINRYLFEDISAKFSDKGLMSSSLEPLRFEYALVTPYRLLTGVAYQIKKIALVSADYEYVNYRVARFYETGDGYDYSLKNYDIKDALRAANNIRLGGEIRLNKLYLRSGYGYYGKAFRSGDDNEGLDYNSISFGIGIREQNVSVDFGYTRYNYSRNEILYYLPETFDPEVANFSTINDMFTLTLGFKFGY